MDDKKAFEIQQQVRVNAQQFQAEFASLKSFEEEIKQKEKSAGKVDENSSKNNMIPIRSDVSSFESYLQSTKIDNEIAKENDVEDRRKVAAEYKEKGNGFFKNKKYESAVEMYSQAIEACPDDAVFYSNRSQCYLLMELFTECINDAESAIRLDKKSHKSYFRRMTAYEKLNEDMKALKNCQEWMSELPEDQLAKSNYDRIHNKLIESAKAKEKEKIKWTRSLETTHFINKPSHAQSKRSLKRVDVHLRKTHSPIPDDVIDRIFNNNTGEHSDSKLFKSNFLQKPSTSVIKSDSQEKIENVKNKVNETNKILKDSEEKKEPSLPSLEELEKLKNDLISLPATGPQFYTAWKELDDNQKFLYLKNLADRDVEIGKLLGAQLDSSMLKEVINVVHKYFTFYNLPYIKLIYELSKNSELSILAMFLEKDDKEKLTELLNVAKHENDMNNMIHQINHNFLL